MAGLHSVWRDRHYLNRRDCPGDSPSSTRRTKTEPQALTASRLKHTVAPHRSGQLPPEPESSPVSPGWQSRSGGRCPVLPGYSARRPSVLHPSGAQPNSAEDMIGTLDPGLLPSLQVPKPGQRLWITMLPVRIAVAGSSCSPFSISLSYTRPSSFQIRMRTLSTPLPSRSPSMAHTVKR